MRHVILTQMGQSRNEIAEDRMMQYLQNRKFSAAQIEHIMECFRTLGKCGSSRSVPFLRKTLLHRKWMAGLRKSAYREGAALALVALKIPEARQIIEAAGRSFHPGLRRIAREAGRKFFQKNKGGPIIMSEKQSIAERLGHDFLRALYHMISTVRMYEDNNQLVQTCVSSFQNMLNELTVSGDITLLLYRSRFHLGGEKLRYRRDAAVVAYNMVEFFSNRGIGSVTFLKSSHDVAPENIITFSRLFNDAIRHETPIVAGTKAAGKELFVGTVSRGRVTPDAIVGGESPEEKRYENARKNYFLAIEAVKEVANKVSQGMVGMRKSRRVAQNIVDMVKDDPTLMIGLATLEEYDDYIYAHSVNVALLAACLGRHIELSDTSLEHLTICGLFHDLGKVDVPKEIIFKHGDLSDGEWDLLKAHPVMGVRKILMLNATPSLRSRIILGPFEHHLNMDMTGYPRTHVYRPFKSYGKDYSYSRRL